MKKYQKWVVVTLLSMLFVACGKEEREEIIFGFGPSTYVDQFEKGIRPILEEKGYKVKAQIFTQNMQINPALKEGEIDIAGHQSVAYMSEMNPHLGMNMVKLVDTASAPQSLRSTRHHSLEEVKAGMTVAIPNDPINGERAARILESIGWMKVKDEIDVARFSVADLIPTEIGIKVVEVDAAQGLRILEDVDFAVINGNYVANAGLKMSDGLVIEETPEEHVVVMVIRGEDADKPWAKAVKEAYESPEFEAYIRSEPLYDGFILPKVWGERGE